MSIDDDFDDTRIRELNDERHHVRRVLREPLAFWVRVTAGLVILLVVLAMAGISYLVWRVV